jgi:hypothetical protein
VRAADAQAEGLGVIGDDGTRTHDLRIANATLSQLSYVPAFSRYDGTAPGAPVKNHGHRNGRLVLAGGARSDPA